MENQGSFWESATGKEAEKSTSRAFATRAKNTRREDILTITFL